MQFKPLSKSQLGSNEVTWDAWAEKTQGTSGDGLPCGEWPHQDPERPAHSQQIQHQGTSYKIPYNICKKELI